MTTYQAASDLAPAGAPQASPAPRIQKAGSASSNQDEGDGPANPAWWEQRSHAPTPAPTNGTD